MTAGLKRWLSWPLVLTVLAIGCSDRAALPLCTRAESAIAEPNAGCREEAATVAFTGHLAGLLEPAAGGTRVQLLFGADARVRAQCADRSPGISGWRERRRLAEEAGAVHALPPGPGCLAGTRLALNRVAAREQEIDGEMLNCRERYRTRRQQDSSVTGRMLERDVRDCYVEKQRDAGELWVFDIGYVNPQPFVATRSDAGRHRATRRCSRHDLEVRRSSHIATLAVARPSPELDECLAGEGWVPYR